MQRIITYTISPEDSGISILSFLRNNGFSKHILTTMKRADHAILLNGQPSFAKTALKKQDVLRILVPEEAGSEESILPVKIPLNILYEDEDILIVNKPKGMVVHPSPGHPDHTLVNAILYHCGEHLSGINGVIRPGIVHRIDMNTTGSLLICKNDLAHQILAEQLKEHSITRRYHAIVHGSLKADTGTVNASIGRHPTDRKKMSTKALNGRHAVTHYRVLERLGNYTNIECELETGRTHQIRFHMASIGCPLLGDSLFGDGPELGISRTALHAQQLTFTHPFCEKVMRIESEIPKDLSFLLR